MAKPNYQYEKRQRDLEKKRKQEAKRQRKIEKGSADTKPETGEATVPVPGGGTAPGGDTTA